MKDQETTELLQIPATISSFRTLSDKGLKITIDTQEINAGDGATLLRLKGKIGWFLFKPTKIAEEEAINIPDEVKEFKTDKTPSQRLRAVIYKYWQTTSKKEIFDMYYRRHLEKLIDQYKDKLNN